MNLAKQINKFLMALDDYILPLTVEQRLDRFDYCFYSQTIITAIEYKFKHNKFNLEGVQYE
jgi:hypothetical protein